MNKVPSLKRDRKNEKGLFTVRERDYITGSILVAASIAMIVSAFIMVGLDKENALVWVAVLLGSAVPLIGLAAFFFRSTTVTISEKYISKASKLGKPVRIPWTKIYAITLEQGVPGDLSVSTIVFWSTADDGIEHITFLSTDEMDIYNFGSIAQHLGRMAEKRGLSFEDESNILRKII